MTFRFFLTALFTALCASAFAYGTGYVNYPLEERKLILSPELTAITSDGGGLGVQARLTIKPSTPFTVDAGFGVAGGEYTGRIFVGADYEIFPDYENQPRFSIKGTLEHARIFDHGFNIVTLAPIVSKGVLISGHKFYPYVSTPLSLLLNSSSNTYNTMINLNLGASAEIPNQTSKKLIGSAEIMISVKDSFSGFLLSLGYPLE